MAMSMTPILHHVRLLADMTLENSHIRNKHKHKHNAEATPKRKYNKIYDDLMTADDISTLTRQRIMELIKHKLERLFLRWHSHPGVQRSK